MDIRFSLGVSLGLLGSILLEHFGGIPPFSIAAMAVVGCAGCLYWIVVNGDQ